MIVGPLFLLITLAIPGYCTNLFLINGPGWMTSEATKSMINGFSVRVRDLNGQFGAIGDSETPIHIEILRHSFKKFLKRVRSEETPLVIIQGDGKIREKQFSINIDGTYMQSSELLEVLTDNYESTRPISILYLASYSNVALEQAIKLPIGSVIIGIANNHADVSGIERSVNDITSKWPVEISALGLLEAFLLSGLKNRVFPSVALVRHAGSKKIVDKFMLDDLLRFAPRKHIPLEVINKVKKATSDNDGANVEAVAQKIARRESIDASEYGTALALLLEVKLRKMYTVGEWPIDDLC